VGEEDVLLEHAVVGVDDREGAGGGVGRGHRGHRGPGGPGLVAGRLGGVQRGPAADPDDDVGRGLAGNLGDAVDLPVRADAPEDLTPELDPGVLERRRQPVPGQLPDVLVGDHQRLPADLGHVPAERTEHAAALDVAAGRDERLDHPGFGHGHLLPTRRRCPHVRVAG
jgi:hypothetical protein